VIGAFRSGAEVNMDKANLHEGREYGFRENIRAWERAEDRPVRVGLVEVLPKGQNLIRLPDGTEARARSAQLILEWGEEAVASLLRDEEQERGFRATTFSDRTVAGAANAVLDGLLGEDWGYVEHDRASLRPDQIKAVGAAANIAHDLADLSPGVHRDEDFIWLPMPVVEMLVKRIAERVPDAVVTEVDRLIAHFQEGDHSRALIEHYKPDWDLALEWAGKGPVELQPEALAPHEGYRRLFDLLRGQGIRCVGSEERAWVVEESQLQELGSLLGPVARYMGRISVRGLGEGRFRLALDLPRDPEIFDTRDMTNFALSLSMPQIKMLVRIREAGEGGLEFPSELGKDRTLESLVDRDLAWESENRETKRPERLRPGRFRLTEGGWRVLELMQAELDRERG
jgi:hypothetical protein